MKNYNENLEKILTAVFSALATIAIFINLHLKGYGTENWMDAIKDIAGLIVVIAVFLIASRIFNINKGWKFNFNEIFEEYLKEWTENNKYLIDDTKINIEKGKDGKRTIYMICNHEDFVKGSVFASKISEKGAFLYLPLKEGFGKGKNQIIQFKINKGMFQHKKDFNYDLEKNNILEKIASRINIEYGSMGINAYKSSESEKIDVDFSKLDQTKENARKLIDVVEFVKTLYLAIA